MELYRRLWPYIKKYLRWTIGAILCTTVVSGMTALTAWLIKPVLDGIFVRKDAQLLYLLPVAVVVIFVVKGIFSYLQSYLIQYASSNVIRDVRDDLYGHMVYLPLSEYHRSTTGKLISNMMNDVGVMKNLMANVIKDFLQNSFTIAGLLVVIFWRDWRLGLVALIIFPIGGVFLGKYGKRMRRISRKAQQSIASLLGILHESFTGSRIVKAFTMEEEEVERFKRENQENTEISIKSARVSSLVAPTMETIGGIVLALVIVYGGSNVIKGTMTTGDFFSFSAALLMLYGPVKAISNLHNNVQQGLAAAERVFDVMDTPNEKDAITRGRSGPDGIRESIVYSGVSFKYDGHEGEVLKGVDLTIRKGEVVAIVGSSGGGKTTLVNLLPRFFEMDKGTITLDGVDIREFPLWSLRKQISVVTQDTILFNDTVANNIAYGRKDASMEEIRSAARAAHADIFIEQMPEKYGTVIGEKGVRLSGGEKQRISIARAVLKDSPILILDEATSSLDTESERIVQGALENLMKNRTTLVIAHRLSTVINADKIVVIDKGVVAGKGPHAELLGSSPIYRKLYEMQFGGLEKEHAGTL
jgi:subfamily B ATP-binding cassette protein MsbA